MNRTEIETTMTPTRIRRARRKRTKVVPSCDGKVRHVLRGAAEREARTWSPARAAYYCPHCNCWHTGHKRRDGG